VLILKEVKILCFDTLLQVFILRDLLVWGQRGCLGRRNAQTAGAASLDFSVHFCLETLYATVILMSKETMTCLGISFRFSRQIATDIRTPSASGVRDGFRCTLLGRAQRKHVLASDVLLSRYVSSVGYRQMFGYSELVISTLTGRGKDFSTKGPLHGVQLENSAVRSGFPQRLRSVLALALVSALAFLLSGCGGGGSSAPSPEPPAGGSVISVSVSPTTASINTGQQQDFTAAVANDSQNKGVTWTLTGTGCTGSACGMLSSTSSAPGASITYKAPSSVPNPATVTLTSTSVADTTKSGAAMIAVSVPALKSVAVTPANASFSAGLTQQLTATGTYSDGSTQNLTSSVTWSSSNTSVATIAPGGLAKGVSTGTATIQAASGAITGSTALTVSAAALVSIAVTPANPSVALGLTQQFTATGTFTDGSTQNLTNSVKWTTLNTTVTTISPTGLALGLVTGSATIQAASGSITGTTTLVVSTAALSSIAVAPADPAITQGVTQQFTATGTYTDNSTQDVTRSVTWSSSDKNVATISAVGLATGGVSGDSTIRATYKSVTGTTTLTVSPATLSSIAVTPWNASIAQGLTEQFTATGTYSDGSTHDITTSVAWSSLNKTIATVASGGLAKAVAVGTATIQAAFGSTNGTTTLTVNTAQASEQGQWKTLPYTMPINPIHMAVMHNGKVLVVAGSGNQLGVTDFEGAVWDPQSGQITKQPVPWDMFCNGMVVLADGKPFIFGGTVTYDPFVGAKNAGTYDPDSGTFANLPSMQHGRWYPTGTVLPDGRVMVFSGLDENSKTNTQVEIFTEGSGWTASAVANWTPPSYPRMHVLPNGKVFYSGSSPTSRLFDPDPSSMTWISVATTIYNGTRTYGSSVLLPLTPPNYKPRVIIMGGGSPGTPATATSEIIDLSVGSPQWVQGPSMSQPRIDMNATLLPNGKILATAGSTLDEDAPSASLNADLYDPATNMFSSAGANAFPRLYHSEALLLPDATVLVAGGNPSRGSYEAHLEIYSPAYLFNADGSIAARPAITNVTSGPINYGSNFKIATPDANNISSVVLIRASAVTHSFDMDQRMVVLNFSNGGSSLSATAPPNGNIAPPGYYLLFLLNKNGVPSVGSFVQLSP
jgi:hypothetical protein